MIMKKTLILLFAIFFLIACDNEETPENIIIDKDTDTYVFKNVQYYYEDEIDLQISVYKDSTIYANHSDIEMPVIITSNESGLKRISQFFPEEKPDVNYYIDESIKISAPFVSFIDDNSFSSEIGRWFSLSGSDEWRYSEDKEILPYSGSTTFAETSIPPHTKLYATHEYRKYNLTALYKAIFVGKESEKEITVTGKWKGEWYLLLGVVSVGKTNE